MAYNPEIDEKILKAVSSWKGIESKKMFGGVCYLVKGNMFCGVYKDFLILRLGEDDAAKLLGEPHVRPFDITGRPMKGWVMVTVEGLGTPKKFTGRLEAAHRHAVSLPQKKK